MKNEYFLVKTFKTDNFFYVYDAKTNKIFKVSENKWNIAKKFFEINQTTPDKIEIQHINELSKIIEPSEITNLNLFYTQEFDNIRYHLRNKLNQLVLCVTEKCNLRCRYCIYSGVYKYWRNHSNVNMSENIALKAIDILNNKSHDSHQIYIGFYGGEPLLNFELIKKCVNYAKKKFYMKNINFSISTNGTLLNMDILKFLKKENFSILVSLDGPQFIHDKWRIDRSGRPTFELIQKKIKNIKESYKDFYNNKVSFSIVVTPPYEISEIETFFSSPQFNENHITATFIKENDITIDISLSESNKKISNKNRSELINLYIDNILNNTPDANKIGKSIFEKSLRAIHNRSMTAVGNKCIISGICIPTVRKLFVEANGVFRICERIASGPNLGNVYNGLDEEACISTINKYKKLSASTCVKCWAIRLCGVCFAGVYKGDIFDVDRKQDSCKYMRAVLEESLRIYATILERDAEALEFLKIVN